MTVQRYSLIHETDTLLLDSGSWVKYEDYDKLVACCQELQDKLSQATWLIATLRARLNAGR